MGREAAGPPRKSFLIPLGTFFFKYRGAVFPLVMVTLFLAFKPVYPGGRQEGDRWLDVVGLLVTVSGQAFRAAVIGYAYIKRGGKDKKVYADKLVTEGFFNHSRNPLYVGNILVYFGLFLLHNNPWVYAIGVPFVLFVYVSIVAAEEDYLRGKFGQEYEAYCRRVNKWVPSFRGLRKSLEGMTFHWHRLLVKEHGSTFAWITAALFLLAYETLTRSSFERHRVYLEALAGCFLVVAAGWAIIRVLKTTKRLRAD